MYVCTILFMRYVCMVVSDSISKEIDVCMYAQFTRCVWL